MIPLLDNLGLMTDRDTRLRTTLLGFEHGMIRIAIGAVEVDATVKLNVRRHKILLSRYKRYQREHNARRICAAVKRDCRYLPTVKR